MNLKTKDFLIIFGVGVLSSVIANLITRKIPQ